MVGNCQPAAKNIAMVLVGFARPTSVLHPLEAKAIADHSAEKSRTRTVCKSAMLPRQLGESASPGFQLALQ
jgi:hypothetical protein